MTESTRQTILGYGTAAASVLVVVVFKMLVGEFIPNQQAFLLFLAAIGFTAWFGGVGPGVVSAVLSAICANYFFMFPYGTFSITSSMLFQMLLYLLEALFVVGLLTFVRNRQASTPSLAPQVTPQDQTAALLEAFQVYAPVGLAFLDNDLRFVRINYAMAEANGLTPAAHVGRRLQDIQAGITAEMVAEIQQVIETGKPLLDQEFVVDKPTLLGVKKQYFLTSYYRLRGTDGLPIGIGVVMVDITAYKEAEASLRESEARFRTMADNAPVLIWLADEKKQRTYFNKTWLLFTGRTVEQEIGYGWRENLHPDDYNRFLETYSAAFEARQEYRMEYRLRRHDGEYRWILATGVPRYLPDGSFNGFIGTCFDIHERKQLEVGEKFLTEASLILASSLDYETTLANVAKLAVPTIADWCAVDILTPEGGVRRLAVAHVDPEKVRWAYELQERYPVDMDAPTGLPAVLRTGKAEFIPEITEEMLTSAAKDAEMYQTILQIGFTSVLITPLTARGRTLGALTLVTTESRRHMTEIDVGIAEQLATCAALAVDNASLFGDAQREQERFRVTLTSVGDAVIATDNHGSVTFINQVAESLTGWSSTDALGKELSSIFNIVNEQTREVVESPVSKVLREGGIVGLANHTVLISRDGSEVPIDDSGAPIPGPDGGICGVVLVFRDVSERKRAEKRQRFLAEATTLLMSSIDYEATLQHVTDLAVPTLADWAIVYLVNADQTIQQAAAHHIDPAMVERRRHLIRQYPTIPSSPFGYPKVIRSGVPELLPEVTDDILKAAAINDEHLQMLRGLNYKSSLCVPLRNTQGVFGAFTLATLKDGRTLNEDDLALAEELGRIVSLAIENARLYRQAQSGSPPDQNNH